MIISEVFLCTQEEFNNAKTKDLIPLECTICNKEYTVIKRYIVNRVRDRNMYPKYCTKKCEMTVRNLQIKINCTNCQKEAFKTQGDFKAAKNPFCSRSCSASWNNKNKEYGTVRSKLEVYIEQQLTLLYPDLEILYSNKKVIGSELDVYIPSLKVGIEIQGIFHYKPIFGEKRLQKIQINDLLKIQKCKELEIELHHIDVSKQNKFSPKSSEQFLEIIKKLITV